VVNDFNASKPEFAMRIDEERAARFGVDTEAAGLALLGAIRGIEATRLRWGNDEVRLRVKYPESFLRDPENLRGMLIPGRFGERVPLATFTEIERRGALATVIRRNQQRMITVSADLDLAIATSSQVNQQIANWIPELEQQWPGYRINLAGENEDTERSVASMKFAAFIAFLLIYVILAVIFNSFLQPLVVMSVIPFGIIGVIGGLLLMGEPLGLMAMMGTIALSGIVVNNSVVFVDFINQFRKAYPLFPEDSRDLSHAKFARWHSIMETGRIRFRPIFLTTATTIGGLGALAFTTSGQEQFLAPMAQAIVFGLGFAAAITLILIPCLYAILDDVAMWRRRRALRVR
jgi:multidrug efflux pump subunit AcrB